MMQTKTPQEILASLGITPDIVMLSPTNFSVGEFFLGNSGAIYQVREWGPETIPGRRNVSLYKWASGDPADVLANPEPVEGNSICVAEVEKPISTNTAAVFRFPPPSATLALPVILEDDFFAGWGEPEEQEAPEQEEVEPGTIMSLDDAERVLAEQEEEELPVEEELFPNSPAAKEYLRMDLKLPVKWEGTKRDWMRVQLSSLEYGKEYPLIDLANLAVEHGVWSNAEGAVAAIHQSCYSIAKKEPEFSHIICHSKYLEVGERVVENAPTAKDYGTPEVALSVMGQAPKADNLMLTEDKLKSALNLPIDAPIIRNLLVIELPMDPDKAREIAKQILGER